MYEAATREMLEETGLRIEPTSLYTVTSLYGESYKGTEWYNPEQQSVMIWFMVKVDYFSYEELPRIAFPVHENVIRKLLEEQLIS